MSFPAYPANKESGVEWLGEAPESWSITPLKFCASCNDTVLPDSTDDDYEIEYVEISDVNEISGITGSTSYKFSDAPSRARRMLQDGDVLISTVRTYLRAIAPVVTPAENLIASTGFAVVRPRKGILDGTFLGYLLRAEWWISEVIARSVGVSYPAINASDLIGLNVPVPAWHEQTQIARFLDHETARIDALIEEQQRLIELLKEKRQALISHAVTKGLDPTVPMKDSNVEWLGEVPAHWGVKALRYLGECQNGINIGGEAFGSGSPFVSYGDVYKNDVLPAEVTGLVQSSPEDQQRYSIEYGDVFFTRTSETVDEIGFSATCLQELPNAVFAGFLIRFRPTGKSLMPGFSKYYFRNQGLRIFFNKEMNLVTRASLSQDLLKLLPVTLPPIVEQIKISDFLDKVTAEFASLLEQGIKAIDLLKERRSALISAAVTGKIDVRGWQPPASAPTPELVQEAV
jgi:type I restriction enzyme S subunit